MPTGDFFNLTDNAGYHYYFAGNKIVLHYIQIVTGITSERTVIPSLFELYQNYPNPFNPSTIISFSLPTRSFVSLKVFDLIGREVATIVNEELAAGAHKRQWDATNISSGIYFYRLWAGTSTETKKLVLLR